MTWIILLLVIYAGWVVLLYFKQASLLFPREFAGTPHPDRPPTGVEAWWVEPEPGVRVEAWFTPAPTGAGTPAPAVVFFHGNAELIDDQTGLSEWYHQHGFAVLLVEYRGYGASTGEPTQRGLTNDAAAFVEQLLARDDIDPQRVIYHGRSLGGGVLAQVALRHPPAAIVTEATFKSVSSYAWRYGVPPIAVRFPFRTDLAAPKLTMPWLLLHGRDDSIVPVEHSKALAELAPASDLRILPGDHNDLYIAGADVFAELERFYREHGLLPER